MASVAKWLRQWIVVPPLAGSSPVVRPSSQCSGNQTWNRHLACFNFQWKSGVEQASCLFQLPGGQDAHSTPIQREDSAMPRKCRSRFTSSLLPLSSQDH